MVEVSEGRLDEFRSASPTVLACAIGVGAGVTGMPFYSVGLFMKPLVAEYGWSRASISGAALCLQAGIVLSAPLVGRTIDRRGIRQVALSSLAGLALGFVGLGFVNGSLSVFLLAWLVLSLLGCGTTPVVWTRAINLRFKAGRGLALGLMLLGTGLAGILAPLLLGPIINSRGWRAGAFVLAGVIAFISLPAVALLLRKQASADPGATLQPLSGCSLRHAIRTRHFVQIAFAFFCIGVVVAGAIVHLVPLLVDHGLDPAEALHKAAALGVAVIVGRVLVGWLCDRFHAPYVAFCFLMLPVAGFLLLFAPGWALASVVLLGLAAGAEIDLLAYFTSRYFGLSAYGEIYGWLVSIFSLGAGIGPVLVGLSFDETGSYTVMLVAGSILLTVGALMIACLGPFPNHFLPLPLPADTREAAFP